MSEQKFVYRHAFTVTFDEVDPAGISYFGNAYVYAHRAYEAFLASLGVEDFFECDEFVAPFVHSEAEHDAPMRHGEDLHVDVLLERLGETSMTFRYVIADDAGQTRARVRLVCVFVDRDFQKIPIPPDIRQKIAGAPS